MHLTLHPSTFCVHRLAPTATVPTSALASPWFSITRTQGELSIVCASDIEIEAQHTETGWRALEVQGPLDFALTGILAELSGILADGSISLFAISTYDTDVLLVKRDTLDAAIDALRAHGHVVITP